MTAHTERPAMPAGGIIGAHTTTPDISATRVTTPGPSGTRAGAHTPCTMRAVPRPHSGPRSPHPAFRHPQVGCAAQVERSAALRALGPEERRGWL